MVEIGSNHPSSSTNTITQDPFYTGNKQDMCSDCFVFLLSSVYTKAF